MLISVSSRLVLILGVQFVVDRRVFPGHFLTAHKFGTLVHVRSRVNERYSREGGISLVTTAAMLWLHGRADLSRFSDRIRVEASVCAGLTMQAVFVAVVGVRTRHPWVDGLGLYRVESL